MSSRVVTIKRILHYDIMRVLACIMVIATHAPIPHEGWCGPLLSSLSYFCAPCIGLFFMISGALLLNKQYQERFDTKVFLKKKFVRILCPTVFWFITGYILSYCGIRNSEIAVLWFMFTMIGLYLLTPVIYRWVSAADKREIEFYLLIWIISLFYPILNLFVNLDHGPQSWIYYFYGYAGYFILGFYLAKYKIQRTSKVVLFIAFCVFSLAFPFLSYYLHLDLDIYTFFWFLSPSVVLQCVIWWFVANKLCVFFDSIRPVIEFVSKHSFGIYLMHILILRNILWKLNWINSLSGIAQIIVCVILTMCVSLFFSWVLSRLRIGKYIVGS